MANVINIMQDKIVDDVKPNLYLIKKQVKDAIKERVNIKTERIFNNNLTLSKYEEDKYIDKIRILSNSLKDLLLDKNIKINSSLQKAFSVFGNNISVKVLSSLLLLLILIASRKV